MSDVFTASNGTKIETSEKYGGLEVTSSEDFDYLLQKHVDALREWFRAERDEELGRWRDPESPDWVVYPMNCYEDVRYIRVMNERDGRKFIIRENELITGASFHEVAGRWFAAHPVRKPWHDARPGEAWVITIDGYEWAVVMVRSESSGNGLFASGDEAISITSPRITAGRRVWAPDEGDDDE
ncbi:hypothetical protein [Gulosibacter massiliensis]|uniref:hypothetical protein n=1 Tax=Gulosibacter massiliensis TaxID=2479839 RepID=UPI000F6431FD|nr:hypothetical protein [Gulosibacter massiliensis]